LSLTQNQSWTKLRNLTQQQINYYNDQHRFLIITAGRRSRKTLIGKRKLLISALEKPGRYFHGAPTHKQAKDIFWDSLKQDTTMFRTQRPNETDRIINLYNGSEIHVLGLDRPERIEGQPWHGCHITEIANVKDGAWQANIRPALADTEGWAILDGVPEGKNFLYDLALYACDHAIPKTEPIKGAYGFNPADKQWAFYTWFSSDVLSAGEIQANKNTLDERTYKQEYEGSFEDVQGLLYYAFGQHNASNCKFDKNDIVHIGMDFNVNPMTATFSHIEGDVINVFGEAHLVNSNTMEMAKHIKERFLPKQCYIYPDATGKAMESNASESDLAILRKEGFVVRARTSNPYVKDRVAAVNSKLKSFDGKVRLNINFKNCPKLVNDFNRVEATDDGRENKKQEDEGLVHISSALGYNIAYLFPVRQRTVTNVVRH